MLGPQIEPRGPRHVLWEGKEYLFFGGNDYHRFAFHSEVVEASIEATRRWGLNLSGSRTTSANHPIYEELECRIAEFLGAEDAAVFSAGYMSNAILIQAAGDSFTHILLDSASHSSLVDAAQASGLPVARYSHCSVVSLRQKLALLPTGAKPLILTDGVFASTGEIAPLAEIDALGLTVLIDDAHGMATIGEGGKGTWSACRLSRERLFQSGTLSKGLGGFGGLLASDRETIRNVRERSSAFAGSTPMPIPMAAAALKSLDILLKDTQRVDRLQRRSIKVKEDLRGLGFHISEGPAPICSVSFLDKARNQVLYNTLGTDGLYPNFINYPGSPPGGHFRFTLSSAHTEEDIERLLHSISKTVALVE